MLDFFWYITPSSFSVNTEPAVELFHIIKEISQFKCCYCCLWFTTTFLAASNSSMLAAIFEEYSELAMWKDDIPILKFDIRLRLVSHFSIWRNCHHWVQHQTICISDWAPFSSAKKTVWIPIRVVNKYSRGTSQYYKNRISQKYLYCFIIPFCLAEYFPSLTQHNTAYKLK